MKIKSKWVWRGICLSIFLLTILVLLFHETILLGMGKYMAPDGDYKADVAIVEGNGSIQRGTIMKGMNMLLSGKVKGIVFAVHQYGPPQKRIPRNENYIHLLKKEIESLGLKKREFKVIETPILHPATLTEAKITLETISQEKIKSAVLLSEGFHTRRSFLVYQHIGHPLQIKIFPFACFNEYQLDRWWVQEAGVFDFCEQVLKLAYYMVRGYIPFTLSY